MTENVTPLRDKVLLTVAEAAQTLGLGQTKLRELITDGGFTPSTSDGHFVFRDMPSTCLVARLIEEQTETRHEREQANRGKGAFTGTFGFAPPVATT